LSGTLNNSLEKEIIQLLEPKRPEEVGSMAGPLYCQYHRMNNHPIEKCVTLKDRIMRLTKDGKIILDLDNAVKTNHIFYQTKGFFIIQFESLELVFLYELVFSSQHL